MAPTRLATLVFGLCAAIMVSTTLGWLTPSSAEGAPSVLAWGGNDFGQLGDGTTTPSPVPKPGPDLAGVTALAAGDSYSLAIAAGAVTAWGVIPGTDPPPTSPTTVPGITAATAVAAGTTHGLALLADGTVAAWGGNFLGQLGDGTTDFRPEPVPVSGLSAVTAIAAGTFHSLALTDGKVMAWGSNANGQLGDGTTTSPLVPVAVTGITAPVTAIAAGGDFSMAVTADGEVFAWGANASGQLGDGTTTDRSAPVPVQGLTSVQAVSGGGIHAVALTAEGTVTAWGNNGLGQLGDGTTNDSLVPVQVKDLTGVTTIAAGGQHNLAGTAAGLVAWGANANGQLGDGTTTDRSVPVAVRGLGADAAVTVIDAGGTHSLAVASPPALDTTTSSTSSSTSSTSSSSSTSSTSSTSTTAVPQGGCPNPTAASASPSQVSAGSRVTVAGCGFGPSQTLKITLFSDPVSLGTTTSGASGAFTAEVTMPSTIASGQHRLVVSGTNPQGQALESTALVTVASANTPSERPAAGSPSAVSSAGATPASRGAAATSRAAGGALPRTGGEVGRLIVFAAGAIGGGFLLLAAVRRKRDGRHHV